jgi:hypothetical protein
MIHLFIGRENGEIDHQLVFYEKKLNKKRRMQGASTIPCVDVWFQELFVSKHGVFCDCTKIR